MWDMKSCTFFLWSEIVKWVTERVEFPSRTPISVFQETAFIIFLKSIWNVGLLDYQLTLNRSNQTTVWKKAYFKGKFHLSSKNENEPFTLSLMDLSVLNRMQKLVDSLFPPKLCYCKRTFCSHRTRLEEGFLLFLLSQPGSIFIQNKTCSYFNHIQTSPSGIWNIVQIYSTPVIQLTTSSLVITLIRWGQDDNGDLMNVMIISWRLFKSQQVSLKTIKM